MNLDSALEPDCESDDGPPTRTKPEPPPKVGTHTERVAALFRDEYPKLVHYMVSKTNSWPEARDIAAQAFAQILEMRAPETVSYLKAYVYRAARNLATDRARAGAIRNRLNRIVRHEFASTTPSPEPQLMQQQRVKVLGTAIEALRPTRKMVLRWRMWDELPYAEIESRFAAEGVCVNERTLLRWYAEALRELREAILEAEELNEERA
jgi:RNA polymerase sigma-70 factor (ECF subfamily)